MLWLQRFWYQKSHPMRYFFYPFHLILYLLVAIRSLLYQKGIFSSHKANIPVIVVGNISVGGTGKSPVVISLAQQLSKAGYKIGILSRGYGGQSDKYPLNVEANSNARVVGDEPLMIKLRTNEIVVVDPIRSRGAKFLENECHCNIIICDDGLQHYQLQRDIEILVVDGNRMFGNGLLMPFGPLREPLSRATSVDAKVININKDTSVENSGKSFRMTLSTACFVSVKGNKEMEVKDFLGYCKLHTDQVYSVAGIGHPQRFFNQLDELGIYSKNFAFDDHHKYVENDFLEMNGIVLMTEKDAVKCRKFATDDMWYLKVDADITPSLSQHCIYLLKN
ncbi:MAG: tetraacyldisaccharide 4'-kinase [Gammaproteobacteria bacterium]|nr:tetraacyldisaccharide 4'-kinase [Gammaproteobacteria bacterium]